MHNNLQNVNKEKQGEILKRAIRAKFKSMELAANSYELSRRQLYNYFEMDILDESIIEYFKNRGLQIELENSQIVNRKTNEVSQVEFDAFMEVEYLPRYAQAGYLQGYSDNFAKEHEPIEKMLVPKEFEKGNYLVLEVNGHSMDDGSKRAICEGDKLLAKELDKSLWQRNKLHYRDYLFVIMTLEDGITVKQIINHDLETGIITCHSWNEMFKDFTIDVNTIIKLFYVKKIVERRISM